MYPNACPTHAGGNPCLGAGIPRRGVGLGLSVVDATSLCRRNGGIRGRPRRAVDNLFAGLFCDQRPTLHTGCLHIRTAGYGERRCAGSTASQRPAIRRRSGSHPWGFTSTLELLQTLMERGRGSEAPSSPDHRIPRHELWLRDLLGLLVQCSRCRCSALDGLLAIKNTPQGAVFVS